MQVAANGSDRAVKISVLMPVRNGAAYIVEALNSILSSGRDDIEIIVIDDGSTDNSAQLAQSLGTSAVVVTRGPAKGISAALNAGLDIAKGMYIARCDADDCYPPDRLNTQMAFLDKHPEYGAVCGGFSMMGHQGDKVRSLLHMKNIEITDELISGVTRTHLCSYLIRKSCIKKLFGFRPFFQTAEDIDFQLRLGEATRVFYCSMETYRYRLHDSSITHTHGVQKNAYYEGLARKFQRQRLELGCDDLDAGRVPPAFDAPVSAPRSANRHAQDMLLGAAWESHSRGQKWHALTTGLRAVAKHPRNLGVWKSVVALLIKRPT